MEFSYRITEADYLRVWKLRRKPVSRWRFIKVTIFWVFILVCLVLLWGVVQRSANMPPANVETAAPTAHGARDWGSSLIFPGVMACWVALVYGLAPARVRRLYRKDPMVQGEYSVNITPQAIFMRNTAGATSQTSWNLYEYWRESMDLILLVLPSGACFPINLAGLSDIQRSEARALLTQALQKK